MIEIQLPCCDGHAVIDAQAGTVRCEVCNLTLELAPDATETRPAATALPAAA